MKSWNADINFGRAVVNLRGMHHPLDVAALELRLGNVLSNPDSQRSRRHSSSGASTPTLNSDRSPDPEWEASMTQNRLNNEKKYHDLIRMGGRPAFPVELWNTPKDVHGRYGPIVDYWRTLYGEQRNTWIYFRRFQRRNRKNVEIFTQYQQDVRNHRQNEGIEGDIQLLFDAKEQTKVDEWKEYHYFQHRNLPQMRAEAEEGRQMREQQKLEWETVNGSSKTIDLNEPPGPALGWVYRTIAESDLARFMVLLNWIEEELPKIAQEVALSNPEAFTGVATHTNPIQTSEKESRLEDTASTDFNTENNMNSNRSSTNRSRKSNNPVLKPVGSPRVTKAGRNTRSSVRNQQGHHNTPHGTKGRARAAMTPTKPPIPPVTALRRSQRIIDLAAKKSQQPEPIQEVPRQGISKPISRKEPKERKSKGRRPSPQAKPQGITKSRPTRKKNPLSKS
ncbi:hypothetical protein GX50_00776 [[Emmonsia] crescens]|uniref:Uncharacterized protein n=1 Tax=[Emmonsia] crescens TaxID=73230 RepID=A0A2B7ZT27_9EURO|nr:hypothetical protein GX50_00776 [Emmonsia crescens]